jgi:hypothetical protein
MLHRLDLPPGQWGSRVPHVVMALGWVAGPTAAAAVVACKPVLEGADFAPAAESRASQIADDRLGDRDV